MPKLPGFPIVRSGDFWRINIPPACSPTGRRQRKFFDTHKKASDERTRLLGQFRLHGSEGKTWLSASESEQARAAFDLLETQGATIAEAVRFYLAAMEERTRTCTVAEAFALFQTAKVNRSDRYMNDVRQLADHMVGEVGDAPLSDLTEDRLSEILRLKYGGRTNLNVAVRTLRAVFGWAVKKGKAKSNPARKVDLAEVHASEPEILLPDQSAAVIRCAMADPDTVPAFVLMLFCGIRPQETARLLWRHINVEGAFVMVPATAAKTRQTRYVPLHATALAWLRSVPAGDEGDWVVPSNWKRRCQAVRRAAGIGDKQDVLRHSFASAWLANGGTMEGLLLAIGHTTPAPTLRHYVGGMLPRHAIEFWGLTPDVVKGKAKKTGKGSKVA